MGTLKSLLCVSLLWWMPAQSYNTNRYICESPATEDVCHYLESPNLMHIIQKRYDGGVRLPARVLVEDVPMAPRQGIYFDEHQPEHIMKHINFGYLNLNQPISSMGDLIDMESDEIGSHYIPKQKPLAVSAWKMDDVKTLLAAPKVLPDIMLNQEDELHSNLPENPHYLDEDDAKLGRFVVNDSPSRIPDIIRTENSELTQETQDISHSEIGEKYLYDPARYHTKAHTLVIDKVVPRKEKEQNFMEELYKIKLALALAQEEAEAHDQKEAPEEVFPIPGGREVTLPHTLSQHDTIEPAEDQIDTVPEAVAVPKGVLPAAVVPEFIPEDGVPEAVVQEGIVPEVGIPEDVVPEAVVPEAVVPEAEIHEVEIPEAEVPEVAAPEAINPEAVFPEAIVSDAVVSEDLVPEAEIPDAEVPEVTAPEPVDPEAVDPEAVVPEAIVTSEHIPEQECTESPSVIGHEEATVPEQSDEDYQARNNGIETFPGHSDNIIEKEKKLEKAIEDKHFGKTSTLDLKAKKNVEKLSHHLATNIPVDKSLFGGDSPKVIVVAEEQFVSNADGSELIPKKKRRKSSKNQKSSKVGTATDRLYFLPAETEIPTEEAGDKANKDDLNVTKKRKKSNKKKTPKVGLVPEEESTTKEHVAEKVKKQKRPKLGKLPESPETLVTPETSIESPLVIAEDSELPKPQKISSKVSTKHKDSLLDGLLRVL